MTRLLSSRFFSSLRARFGLLILVATIPILLLTLSRDLTERELAISDVEDDVQRSAQFAAVVQEQLIEGARQVLVTLSRSFDPEEIQKALCDGRLVQMLAEFSRFTNIGVVSPQGDLLCNAAFPADARINLANQPWFERVCETLDFTAGSGKIFEGAKNTLNFAYPRLDEEGKLHAVLFLSLDLDQLNQLTSEVQLPENAEFIMITRNGTILACLPDPEKWVGRTMREVPIVKSILSRGQDILEVAGLDGVIRLYAFTPLRTSGDTELYVTIGIPTSTAYAQANRGLVRHLVQLGLVTLVALLAVWFGGDIFILRKINALVRAAERLSTGDMKSRTGLAHGSSELGELARAFDEMAESLEQRAMQMRALASELSLAEERERRRIAVELHDRVGQALALAKIKLGLLRESLPIGEQKTAAEEVRSLIEQAIQDTRCLIFRISSPILYELGFEAALEWLAEQAHKQHGLNARFEDDHQSKPLDDDIRVLLFQAVNELVVNVAKHAQAKNLTITARRVEGCIHVSVMDDGVGFDSAAAGKGGGRADGFGLFSIRERLSCVHGDLEIESRKGLGTCVTLKAPLKRMSSGDPSR